MGRGGAGYRTARGSAAADAMQHYGGLTESQRERVITLAKLVDAQARLRQAANAAPELFQTIAGAAWRDIETYARELAKDIGAGP